jgi:reversibly glycosylated polypeptide/UDP-arabinopyranose mutase
MTTALVIPTIRESSLQQCLKQWSDFGAYWDHIIIVEDNPTKTFTIESSYSWRNIHHYAWDDIDEHLGPESWIISRRDSAIRSYGFLKAYEFDCQYIFTLDDDCLPLSKSFVKDHINNLEKTPRWIESIPGQRTRGLPYRNRGIANNVMLSVGLWTGNPDFDAIQTLNNADEKITLPETYVLPMGQYIPICGMNMAFKKELTPLCYFALSGEGVPFRRFDDIWFGLICKKICDHLGLMITCGKPTIFHSKASNPFVNLVKEAPGIAFNETFWEFIEGIKLNKQKPVECMAEVGIALQSHSDVYAQKYGKAIEIWTKFF